MSTKGELLSKQPKSSAKVNSVPSSVAFIHNFLDEYGLDPYEFRLYAHIVRRTGGKPEGVCFASLRKTAEICKMSMRKAQQAIKVLIKANLVTQSKRRGRTDEYRVTPVSDWVPSEKLEEIRKVIVEGGKGSSALEGKDNTGTNILIGNSANNIFNGNAGDNTLTGV